MENRPKMVIRKTPLENAFDLASLFLFAGSIGYIGLSLPSLPDRVPVHFNFYGEVDRWGSKGMIFFLPMIGAVLWIGLSILEKYPHIYNYLCPITKENAERQYRNGRLMFNVIKNETVLYFAYCSWQNVQAAHGRDTVLGTWDLPLFLAVLFGSIGFFMVRSIRLR